MRQQLPIDDLIPEILATLQHSRDLIIEAAPGAGKTTRVPPALLPLAHDETREILVLEPRRIAARMAARRVAEEMGERLGETVGYQVRFEEVAGPRTRLRFLTEGVFTRRLLSDPGLRRVSAVILDEFHERHLDTDLALALLRRLQKTMRPDLRIVIMSATLDTASVASFLDNAPVLRSQGRLFELAITHMPYSPAPLEQQVAAAFQSVAGTGDILTFLPGAAEIRRAASACDAIARRFGYTITPLYGDLPPAEQDRAVSPSAQPKLILSTNIAESSITIEGVRAVIDSGLARIAADSPWTGIPTLNIGRVSQASCRQRAGRAGRTGPGRVIRLYTAEDFQRRPEHAAPEITARELSQLCLQLEAMGIHDPRELEWLDPPPDRAIDAAESLLDRLHARGDQAAKLARLPVHPRLARLLTAEPNACAAAALLSSGQQTRSSDLHIAIEEEWTPVTKSIYDQLRKAMWGQGFRPAAALPGGAALSKAILQAFPDRVARRGSSSQVLLSNGASAVINVAPSEFFVAIDIEDRADKPLPLIRLACEIQPDWLLDLFPERVTARSSVEWNREAQRVEAVSALAYDKLIIDENRGGLPDPVAAAQLLTEKAFESGIERFVDAVDLEELLARVEFASQHSPIPALSDADVRAAFAELCYGLRSFSQLKNAASSLIPALERRTGDALQRVAPAKLQLPSGRQARVHYERGKTPWIASRLQDFFGLQETPRIAGGKVPVVVQLLAPNNRPVQTTTDLAGFWQRLYPQLRKELGRRYPKHNWPEQPW